MKERPIIFSGPMVRAIRAGHKTQTRRVVKPQPPHSCGYIINGKQDAACCYLNEPPPVNSPTVWVPQTPKSKTHLLPCPFGEPGDRLWVRETWAPIFEEDTGFCGVQFAAGGMAEDDKRAGKYLDGTDRWRSPIHMPRWASRITLEVVSVRVERLNEITPNDCRAEGQPVGNNDIGFRYGFGQQWEADNGPGSWAENPWVWVVEFKRV